MSNRFTAGHKSIAECDICGFRYKLKELKTLVIKTKNVNIKACPTCWDPDHPQLQLGMYPVEDPQAVMNPRPDLSYWQSGNTGLQIDTNGGPTVDGYGTPSGGSRQTQWGWNPIGFTNALVGDNLPNALVGLGQIGTLTVITS